MTLPDCIGRKGSFSSPLTMSHNIGRIAPSGTPQKRSRTEQRLTQRIPIAEPVLYRKKGKFPLEMSLLSFYNSKANDFR